MAPLLAVVPLLLLAAPLPAPCLPACEVLGQGLLGFVAPVVVVQSGATVTWQSIDGAGHINYEGLTNFEEGLSCFVASYSDTVVDGATFTLDAGQLFAAQDGPAEACTFATPLAGGAMALPYQCVLHPLTMKGVLVVVP